MILAALLSLSLIASLLSAVQCHARWKCPQPRDVLNEEGMHIKFDNTGNKYAACGPESGKWGFGTVSTLKPGWTTLTWEESISHTGSPFRISILDESETEVVVLLDHIPHNEDSSPVAYVESTYQEYKVSVYVPDVSCEKCTLQLLYAMTDKTVACGTPVCYYNPSDAACKGSTNPDADTCAGAPNDQVCVQENECFSNYHSCSDVTILGSQPLSTFPVDSQPADWPFKAMPMSYYGAEVGDWANGWLEGVPGNYTTAYDVYTC